MRGEAASWEVEGAQVYPSLLIYNTSMSLELTNMFFKKNLQEPFSYINVPLKGRFCLVIVGVEAERWRGVLFFDTIGWQPVARTAH